MVRAYGTLYFGVVAPDFSPVLQNQNVPTALVLLGAVLSPDIKSGLTKCFEPTALRCRASIYFVTTDFNPLRSENKILT